MENRLENRLNVLVVGCGGREHAIIKKLVQSKYDVNIYCYGNYKNPGIFSLVEAYITGDLIPSKFKSIVSIAKKFKIDFAIIGPEKPIVDGLVDMLHEEHIKCVGPTKYLASLEGSKTFARNLLKKYGLGEHNPKWMNWTPKISNHTNEQQVWSYIRTNAGYEELKKNNFKDIEQSVLSFVTSIGGEFVVKADGLKGGKGVKVQGDHFTTANEGIEWCKTLYQSKESFVIEEKLCGEEFSLISFCDGKNIKHAPPIRDYKRVFNDDKGPNCGGMGSINDLGFLTEEDIKTAQEINKSVMKSLGYDSNLKNLKVFEPPLGYVGFLYGSFIKLPGNYNTQIKVIEYNVRLGDPECMNILGLLKSDFVELCLSMINQNLDTFELEFEERPSKCVYFVPKGYPINPQKNSKIDMTFMETLFDKDGTPDPENDLSVFIAGLENDENPNKLVKNDSSISDELVVGSSRYSKPNFSLEYEKLQTYMGIAITPNQVSAAHSKEICKISDGSESSKGDVVIDFSTADDDYENEIVLRCNGSRTFAILAVGKSQIELLDQRLKQFKDSNLFENLYFRTDIGNNIWGQKNRIKRLTYKDSGVDIDEGNKAVSNIQKFVKSTHTPNVILNEGGFGGMIQILPSNQSFENKNRTISSDSEALHNFDEKSKNPILVASTDSVGSKSEFVKKYLGSLQSTSKIFKNLGHDIVNHCVNDILVQSLETQPLYFLDYFATHHLDRKVFEPFVKGVSEACVNAGCVLLGGETAEIPAIYREDAVDLVGSITGIIQDPSKILRPKETINPGCVVVALSSVSLHTNGFTLLDALTQQSIEKGDYSFEKHLEDWTRPHKSYLNDIRTLDNELRMLDNEEESCVLGLCHVTGGGLVDNPPRILNEEYKIKWDDRALEEITPEWMRWIKDRVSDDEYRRVFNCGIGMLVVLKYTKSEIQDGITLVSHSAFHDVLSKVKGRIIGTIVQK